MLAALEEYEASLDQWGLPRDETMSPLADPGNPAATHHYEARALRNWATDAVEAREAEFKDSPSRARMFVPYRVDH